MKKNDIDKMNELNRLYREQDAIFNSVALRAGMTDTMFWVLYVICNHEKKMSQAEITGVWYFPRQTINSVVKRLQAEGFVMLEHIEGMRADKAVVLTDKGQQFCNEHVIPLIKAQLDSFNNLTPKEQEIFIELFRKQNKVYKELADQI